jgi:hypothetical protein
MALQGICFEMKLKHVLAPCLALGQVYAKPHKKSQLREEMMIIL